MIVADIQVTLIDSMGSDLSVVNAARVSFSKQSEMETYLTEKNTVQYRVTDRDAKLIKYLATHEHKSPFNHCFISFRVKAPIFVARQLVKHKFLPWNEVSRRYVDSEPEFYVPQIYRTKADNVKQGSGEDHPNSEELFEDVHETTNMALNYYFGLLDQGVCPEQARMVLPQNTMTEWIWSGSLGAFADMCRLRLDTHSQQETRVVAEQVAKHLRELFPVSFDALVNPTL